ncbi:unnamed protein product [Phytophthora lilii]|uniref:Unnamed protein product n=1 Tax=Phytophthora lilii TaxID=2077276 RepID=A0A9W7DA85_9STRA|nr:unnamed protein product [Phytophthora lilii]
MSLRNYKPLCCTFGIGLVENQAPATAPRFGVHSVHFQQGCEEFLLLSNTLAMKTLRRSCSDDIPTCEQCGDLLLRAEQHTRHTGYLRSLPEAQHVNHRRSFRLVTLNNLACHATHTGKPLAAVGFLERALKLQLKSQATDSGQPATGPTTEIALTRLNLCAVLSLLHRHAAGAAHARAAVTMLSSTGGADNLSVEVAQLLIVAHYNLAVELEHLSDNDSAWRQYESVTNIADRYQLQSGLVDGVRAILGQGSWQSRYNSRQLSPRAQTLRELYKPQPAMGLGDDDELETPAVPSFKFDGAPLDEAHALSIHVVAKATAEAVAREAIDDLTRAVAGATQWLADAVRGGLISEAVSAVHPHISAPVDVTEKHEHFSTTTFRAESTQILNRPPSAAIHAVAKATVDAVTDEAVNDVVQAVERATEWISQAVENELVSQVMAPDESIAFHNVTDWITQAVRSELVAHAVADAALSDGSTFCEDPVEAEAINTPNVCEDHSVPQLSSQAGASSIAYVRALAKATADAAVSEALTRAIGNTSEWLAQAVRGELLAQAVTTASHQEAPHIEEPDNNSTASEELSEVLSSIEAAEVLIDIPTLQLPALTSASPNAAAHCHNLAVPFVNEVVSSALHQAVPVSSLEPEDYADEGYDDYTPINTPTAEALTKSPLESFRSPTQETEFRGLGTPTSKASSPSSAPSAIPAPTLDDTPAPSLELELPHSILPPLVLPGIHAAPASGRIKQHQHKSSRKTPRLASDDEATFVSDSSRVAPKRSSRLEKYALAAELELTPLSSARAAAQIYAQQPSSSRHHHHHHKSKKLRDTASQTSPPPSPSLTTLPRQLPPGAHDDSTNELPKKQTKHSPRDISSPENGPEKKFDGGSNNTLLAPLSKTPVVPPSSDGSPTKAPSPSRTHRNHGQGHGHSHKGSGGGPSPNKRSGYCQRCVFEGRSCKINDCLKHQVLK